MKATTLKLVLFVSCAHALVHTFELALPSVELDLASDYGIGKPAIGLLSTCWRLPWGIGALGAGWLVDRLGARRMLTVYLVGCGLVCGLVALRPPLPSLFLLMFTMGSFAAIYHPAGLGLISHETTPENRPRALGWHGIFGSAGIGAAPFLAGIVLSAGFGWQQYYALLAIAGMVLGTVFMLRLSPVAANPEPATTRQVEASPARWTSFFTLTTLALLQGFIYSAILTFLPRYLSRSTAEDGPSAATLGAYWSGAVLLMGCVGQYLAGRFARSDRLERQLTAVTFANIPVLLVMAVAAGPWRIVAAGMFAIVHFMHQPLYNSLIAKYSPRHRRSLCYGFSFAMGLGVGSIGASFSGISAGPGITHLTLAGVAAGAGMLGLRLVALDRSPA